MSNQEQEKASLQEEETLELPKNSEEGGEVKREDQTIKLEDIQEEKEYSDKEYEEMVKLYEDTINEFVEGEVIVGKILSISDKEVSIDIGFKSEGSIPIDEFNDSAKLTIGEDIEVFLDNIEDKEGQLVLSKRKADFMRTWADVLDKFEKNELLQGKCMRRIKGGIVVDIMGIDAFLPGSQIDVKPIRDFDAFIGKTMDFKIVKINTLRKNIVVSHRVLVEEELVGQRQKILDELHKNQVLQGTVKNITDFGVFIDLGGADGLLHINDLSWGRVNHPSEIVALDEKIDVMVLDFNEQKDRISLGLKQLQPHPWEKIDQKYPVGNIVKGKVVNISDYGAFVELEKGVEGLIHISEMSWTQHIKHPSKILAVGETVEAKILNVDQEGKKISLGLKQLEPDPWDLLEGKYPVDSRHKGKVRNLTNFGAFVELEEGIDGLIHISDLSWTKKVRHPAEVVKKGELIDVIVLNVDRENRRISLGYKQVSENPWEKFDDVYQIGTLIQGKVVRLIEKGVIAELNDEVDGFVPISHLAKANISKPADGYKVGDKLDLCVIELSKEAKKIVCSEKIEYAKSLIRQKEAGVKTDEPIIVDEMIDEDFDLEEYSDGQPTELDNLAATSEVKVEDEKPQQAEQKEKIPAEVEETIPTAEHTGVTILDEKPQEVEQKEETPAKVGETTLAAKDTEAVGEPEEQTTANSETKSEKAGKDETELQPEQKDTLVDKKEISEESKDETEASQEQAAPKKKRGRKKKNDVEKKEDNEEKKPD